MHELIELILNTDNVITAVVAENVFKAYLFLFIVIFAETGFIVFPFLPGDGLLFSAGVIAASTDISIFILAPLLIIAAVAGNLINYVVARFFGKNLEKSKNHFVQTNLMKYIYRTRQFYDKHGEKSVIIGRFFPVIRTYIPFFAGLSGFEFRTFANFSIIGALIWVLFFTISGFFLGEVPWVKNNFGLIFLCLIIITLIPFFYNVLKFAFEKKR